jgi:hypothetical protein
MVRAKDLALVMVAAALSQVPVARAQVRRRPPVQRWEVGLILGASAGKAAARLEQAMRANGFGDPEPCRLCSSPVQNPTSSGRGFAASLAVGYAARRGLTLQLELGSANLGKTGGYHYPYTWLFLHSAVRSLAASAVIGSVLRIGAGPSLYLVEVTPTDSSGEPDFREVRLGLVLYAGLRFPYHDRGFIEVAAERRLVGSIEVGPFTARGIGSASVTLPRTPVPFDHTVIRIGFGIRR